MKSLIRTLIIVSCLATVHADTTFNELFDAELSSFNDIADRVAQYHATDMPGEPEQKRLELEALSSRLDAIIKSDTKNPLYWFLRGLNQGALASLYNSMGDRQKTARHVGARNAAYAKAMALDKDGPARLSASVYATMKHGLPETLKIQAIQSELALGGNGDNESYYWNLHWSNISALQQAGRLSEAEQAVKNMQQELAAAGRDQEDYQKIVSRAQADLDRTRAETRNRQNSSRPNDQAAREAGKAPEHEYSTLWLVVIFSSVALLLLIIIEVFFRRK